MIAEIIQNNEINPRCRYIVVHAPDIASTAIPGQFVHVLCGTSYDPLLRRPLGIHEVDIRQGTFSMVYEIRGRGTELLAQRCPGDMLDIIGPLGNGFTLPVSGPTDVLIIAGGIGAAPLYYLARYIKNAEWLGSLSVILGAGTCSMLLRPDAFREITSDLRISTDDGSEGCCGFVTIPLAEYIQERKSANPLMIYTCGPMPMLRSIATYANDYNLACQVSVEAKMACGVGACMSCVIKVKSDSGASDQLFKYVRSCKEGPVFDASEVIWE